MARREGRRGTFGRGTLVATAAAIAILALLAMPGCGSGAKEGEASFASLFDAKSACVLLEWIPAGPAGEADEAIVEPCQQAVEMALLAMGNSTRAGKDSADGGAGAVDSEAVQAVREALGRVVGLMAAGKLFTGPVRYGAMIGAPAGEEMLLPSGADLLVGSPTKEGAEALGRLLEALAARYPEAVRPVDGADPPEWLIAFPSFRGEARVQLSEGKLRAAFGGGSMADERDRLLEGTPAEDPLGDVLPGKPATSPRGGMRLWIRPETMAGPLSETVRRALAGKEVPPELAANPVAAGMMMALRGAAPGAVRELLASFREVHLHRDGDHGVLDMTLGDRPSPVIRLFHDREGTVSAADLAGVPEGAMQAMAVVLPPLDELVVSLVQSVAPEMTPAVTAQLDQPFPLAPGLTTRKLLASLGPRMVFWRQEVKVEVPGADESIPALRSGLVVHLADRGPIDAILGATGGSLLGVRPHREGDVTTWELAGGSAGTSSMAGILALAPDRLVLAPDRETLDAVLSGEGGLGSNERFATLVERLAAGRPVGAISWVNQEAARALLGDAKASMRGTAAAPLPLEFRGFIESLSACGEGMMGRRGGHARAVGVAVRTPGGFHSESDVLPGGEK